MKPIRYAAIAAALALAAPAAHADEVEEALQMALEAYQAGDLAGAKEELDFASQLISQMKAASLAEYLPPAPEGRTRADDSNQASAMTQFGGGVAATANYTRGQDRVEVQIMAENQMVASMAAMFGNTAMLGSMGTVKRLNRQKVVVSQSGDIQTVIDNRIFIQIGGRAPLEDKEKFFEAIDIRALERF